MNKTLENWLNHHLDARTYSLSNYKKCSARQLDMIIKEMGARVTLHHHNIDNNSLEFKDIDSIIGKAKEISEDEYFNNCKSYHDSLSYEVQKIARNDFLSFTLDSIRFLEMMAGKWNGSSFDEEKYSKEIDELKEARSEAFDFDFISVVFNY